MSKVSLIIFLTVLTVIGLAFEGLVLLAIPYVWFMALCILAIDHDSLSLAEEERLEKINLT